MSNVDQIIRYLSGGMRAEEKASFESRLEREHELRSEYEETLLVWDLVRDGIKNRDLDTFRGKVKQIVRPQSGSAEAGSPLPPPPARINGSKQNTARKRGNRFRFGTASPPRVSLIARLSLSAVAALGILVLILSLPDRHERLYRSHFAPDTDPVLASVMVPQRSAGDIGMQLFQMKDYPGAELVFERRLREEPADSIARLFLLIARLELDKEAGMELEGIALEQGVPSLWEQSVAWYEGLALLRAGNTHQAQLHFSALSRVQGPYRESAGKLAKAMSK